MYEFGIKFTEQQIKYIKNHKINHDSMYDKHPNKKKPVSRH